MNAKPTLIFTAPRITHGFMMHDIALLSEFATVVPLDLWDCAGFQRYTYFTKLLDGLIRQRADIVFCYFVMAKYTPLVALLTKLFGRKLILVTGGIDATYVSDIDWGDMRSPLRRGIFAFVMRLADAVLAFSNSSRDEILRYGKPKRMRTAYLGIDADQFCPSNQPRAQRVITVCYSISSGEAIQKGINAFVDAAPFAPGVEFVVHGELQSDARDKLLARAASNVRFTQQRLDRHAYVELLQTASVYVQASAHEGFGVALAEAMACGCVPVVTNRYAMPEVVGDTGYIVPFNAPRALADAIREALNHPEKGIAARQRVVEKFFVAQRRQILREEIECVLGRNLPITNYC